MLHAGVPYNKEFPEMTSYQNINSWFNCRGICMKICVVTPSRYFFRGFISKWHYLQTLLAYDKYISTSFGEIWDRECTLFVVWIGIYTLNHGQITAVWDQNHIYSLFTQNITLCVGYQKGLPLVSRHPYRAGHLGWLFIQFTNNKLYSLQIV